VGKNSSREIFEKGLKRENSHRSYEKGERVVNLGAQAIKKGEAAENR